MISSGKISVPQNQSMMSHDTHFNANASFEWHLEPHASLLVIHEYCQPMDAEFACNIQFFLGAGSSLQYVPIITGGVAVNLAISLVLDNHSQAHVNGAYALHGNQNYVISSRQQHTGIGARSSLAINGIAADQSVINYSGKIAIEKNATQSIASQENKTILIGSHSRAISIPALEVQTNDVHCAHGSAVGPLNEDHIRYAQSRGMPYHQAQRLLLKSFFSQTLGSSLNELVRERIVAVLLAKALSNKEQYE